MAYRPLDIMWPPFHQIIHHKQRIVDTEELDREREFKCVFVPLLLWLVLNRFKLDDVVSGVMHIVCVSGLYFLRFPKMPLKCQSDTIIKTPNNAASRLAVRRLSA